MNSNQSQTIQMLDHPRDFYRYLRYVSPGWLKVWMFLLANKSYDSAPQFCLELYSVQSLNEDVKSETRRQSNNFELLQFRGIKGSIGLRSHLQREREGE